LLIANLAKLRLLLQGQSPVVFLAISEDGFHVFESILVEASGFSSRSDISTITRPSDLHLLLVALLLVLIFELVLLDKICELVDISMIRAEGMSGNFFGIVGDLVIREDLIKTNALLPLIFVSMATLEALVCMLQRIRLVL
jgi:hypothetical protein